MRRLIVLFLLSWMMATNVFSDVVVRSTSCGDDPFGTLVDIAFKTTDFHRVYSVLDNYMQNGNYGSGKLPEPDAATKKLFKSLKRSDTEAKKLKKSWLSRSYTFAENFDYRPKIGPKNNQEFLEWARGKNSALSFCTVFLQIYGKIRDEDVHALKETLKGYANPPFLIVSFDSRGGSVDAGIEIGRIIRKHYGATEISNHYHSNLVEESKKAYKAGNVKKAKELKQKHYKISKALGIPEDRYNSKKYHETRKSVCYSACVLAYAGGIARLPGLGYLGVHQHFFEDSYLKELTVEQGIYNLKNTTKEIENYFNDLEINQDLMKLALSKNAEQMHILTMSEHRLLLPHAVSEYANIIPKKKEEHMKTMLKAINKAVLDASKKYGKKADFRQIMESVYMEISKNKEAFKWANYQDFYLTQGKYFQGL